MILGDLIKLVTLVMMKGVDTDEYVHLVWLWCLGLAWLELELQVLWVFWHTFLLLVPFLISGWVEGFVEKVAESYGENHFEKLSVMGY